MKTYEEAGIAGPELDRVIDQLLSSQTPCASRQFVEALLKHGRTNGSNWVTRQQLAGIVGRDAMQAGSNNWVKDEAVRAYLEARRTTLSQPLGSDLLLDWECQPGKPIHWRTGIRDTGLENTFRLQGSVLRYREHEPQVRLSWWGRLNIPGAGSPTSPYRKWPFQIPLLTAIAIFVVFALYLTLVMISNRQAPLDRILAATTTVAVMLLIYRWMKHRYGTLLDDRVLLLDASNVAGFLDGATLEFDHKDGKKEVQLRRYISECPICNGEVHLTDGARSYPHRLVGRCVDSPQEHVFSFDRVTLEGAPLVARLAANQPAVERRLSAPAKLPAGL